MYVVLIDIELFQNQQISGHEQKAPCMQQKVTHNFLYNCNMQQKVLFVGQLDISLNVFAAILYHSDTFQMFRRAYLKSRVHFSKPEARLN